MEKLIANVIRWVTGRDDSAGLPIVKAPHPTIEEKQSRAIAALDLLVEIATAEVMAKRQTTMRAAQIIFDSMTPEVRRLIPNVGLAEILDAIQAEVDMPDEARREKT